MRWIQRWQHGRSCLPASQGVRAAVAADSINSQAPGHVRALEHRARVDPLPHVRPVTSPINPMHFLSRCFVRGRSQPQLALPQADRPNLLTMNTTTGRQTWRISLGDRSWSLPASAVGAPDLLPRPEVAPRCPTSGGVLPSRRAWRSPTNTSPLVIILLPLLQEFQPSLTWSV